jgi:hypothetical protein
MHPIGFVFIIVGGLQAAGALTQSNLYRALPHFRRSEELFGTDLAIKGHVFFGCVAILIGVLILARVVQIPDKKNSVNHLRPQSANAVQYS